MLGLTPTGQPLPRNLLADTGAGSNNSGVDLILDENDCLLSGGIPLTSVTFRGAYNGSFPLYELRVAIPALGFDEPVLAAGVQSVPAGFDGIACFGFLNRFTYGNFGDPREFGLEV
jgi:hypothetical protein